MINMGAGKFFVYLVECADGSYYCGWTVNLAARVRAHNGGAGGARYTRTRRPVRLVYSERHASRSAAMRREAAIKRMRRNDKEALLAPRRRRERIGARSKTARQQAAGS